MKVILLFLLAFSAQAKPLVIAVIDTGFDSKKNEYAHLCKEGHKDLTGGITPVDTSGHGTNIVEIIGKQLIGYKDDYCIVIIKYWDEKASGFTNFKRSTEALKIAVDMKVDYINYSSWGPSPGAEEKKAVLEFLNQGGHLVVAAGNDSKYLEYGSKIPKRIDKSYPGMYDTRVVMVGNLNKKGNIARSSNFGPAVNHWEIGTDVSGGGFTYSGTSQATAVTTGKMVRKQLEGIK